MSIFDHIPSVREQDGCSIDQLKNELIPGGEPRILRGLVSDWPAVAAGTKGPEATLDYLSPMTNERPTAAYCAPATCNGRFYYGDQENLRDFNFRVRQISVPQVIEELRGSINNPDADHLYAGSVLAKSYLPKFPEENALDLIPDGALQFIWLGNKTRVSAHYDIPNNIACVAAGRRCFTVFPPDAIKDLYVGPLDATPAGQSLSLVDFHNPDYERFPNFKRALQKAQIAELEPGDALYLPSMWWHHVESFGPIGLLVNYWWREVPSYMDPPANTLLHAFLTLRDLPDVEKAAWKALFDHYIFSTDYDPMEHLSTTARGLLGPIDEEKARRLRAMLLQGLNR